MLAILVGNLRWGLTLGDDFKQRSLHHVASAHLPQCLLHGRTGEEATMGATVHLHAHQVEP